MLQKVLKLSTLKHRNILKSVQDIITIFADYEEKSQSVDKVEDDHEQDPKQGLGLDL